MEDLFRFLINAVLVAMWYVVWVLFVGLGGYLACLILDKALGTSLAPRFRAWAGVKEKEEKAEPRQNEMAPECATTGE